MSEPQYRLLCFTVAALLSATGLADGATARPAGGVNELVEQGRWADAERIVRHSSAGAVESCSWQAYDRVVLAYLRAAYYQLPPADDNGLPARLGAVCAPGTNKEVQGAALLLHGRAVYDRTPDDGDFSEADAILKRAWSLNAVHGSTKMRAENLFYLGLVQQFRRNWEDARTLFEQSLRLAEQSDDRLAQALAYRHLGFVAGQTGDVAGARTGAERSLALRLASGAKLYVSTGYLGVGRVRQDAGDLAGAREAYVKATDTAQSGNNRRALYSAQMALAQLLKTSSPRESELWARRALKTAEQFGSTTMAEQARRHLNDSGG